MSALDFAERHLVSAVNALDELCQEAPTKRHQKEATRLLDGVEDALRTVQQWKREAKEERERDS